jgi:hypothetical protein
MISILLAAAAAAVVTCNNTDDTKQIQTAIDANEVVQLVGECKVNGYTSVRIPSNRTLRMYGATVRLIPRCAKQGVCRVFETIVGSGGIKFEGGEVIGDFIEQPTAVGWSIALRVDTTVPPAGQRWSVQIENVTFRQWRSDAIYIGGNTPSRGVRISGVTIDTFGRNAVSLAHSDDVIVERLYCQNAKPGTSPGACIDAESNPGERVTKFHAFEVTAQDVEVCVYMHNHPQALSRGIDYGVYRLNCKRARRHCMVINGVIGSVITGAVCEEAPVGISIGAFAEETRASGALLVGNTFKAARPIVLAGVRDSAIMRNTFPAGKIEAPALGTAGDMIVTSTGISPVTYELPPPPDPPGPPPYPEASTMSNTSAPDDPFGLLSPPARPTPAPTRRKR